MWVSTKGERERRKNGVGIAGGEQEVKAYRLVSLVSALSSQGVLIVPDVVSVPWEEECLVGRSWVSTRYDWLP